MTRTWKYLLGCTAVLASFQAAAQVRLYEHDNFRGRSFTTDRGLGDFTRAGFNDRASSAIVSGGRWVLCDNSRFGGNCVRLRPGRYPSLSAMGLNDRVSSARPDDGGYRGHDRDDWQRGANGHWRDADGRWHDGNGRWHNGDGRWHDGDGPRRDRDGRWHDRDGRWHDGDGRWRDRDRDQDRSRDGRYLDRNRDGYPDGRYQDRDGRWRDRDGRHIDRKPADRKPADRRAEEREAGLTPMERELNRDIRRRQANPEPAP